ncbi:MAG TPA: AIR synthase-related protein, partial [Thermoplasmata archaeon]|nr:AIR synthase-related protein [Thermoplasmata archaeon]
LDEVGVRRRGEKLQSARERGWIRACHDISDGGLACTLAEMAFGGGLGFSVDLALLGLRNALLGLAAEGGSRWVVEVEADKTTEFEGLLEGEPHVRLGVVAPRGGRFTWKSGIISSVDLDGLYAEWREGLNRARAAPP